MFQLSCAVLCFFICFRLVFSEPLTYRLSKEAIPTTYRLTVKPDFENEIFHGEMFIFVKTKDSLDGITLHSYELNISDVYINQLKGYYENGTEDRITVKYTEGHIQPGEHTIHIKYTGKIRRTVGFIKALSGNTENQAYVFVTDLEPNRARRVFPCFDEPSFKANFNIKLISPNETVKAISNMPEIKNFTTSKGVVYEFATSIKMSTYLVSFAFTNFPFYEENFEYKGRNIPIRIYTVNASKENNEFAIDCTKKALTFYSDYTNISYPLPKLDMIEYRRNESAATENWGLITFREGLLTPSLHIYNKFQVQLVVFHELGHFWFGNLVTNDWWNDVWLQEGFATYMSYKLLALDYNRPQLSEMKSFNFDDFLETEIYEDTRPIVTYLPNQSKLTDVFNGMVYEKASALLLMLEEEIGEDNFKEVIRRFLKKHAYATATTNDFITTLEEVVPNKPLRMFLETYLFQNKFPVIEVDILENSTYVLKQQICETLLNDSASHSKWSIPITYKVDSKNTTGPIWFDSDMEELRIDEPNAKWIIFNPKGNGMYKTVWSKNLWPKIIDNFELMDFSTSETVISDAYYSFRFNKIGCDIVIRLMEQAKEKRELMSFFTFFDHLKENLFCEKYSYEATLFWTFLKQRFAKTGYKKNPVNREPESCNNKYIIKTENYLKNLSECANWIREHLKEEDSNMVKRNS